MLILSVDTSCDTSQIALTDNGRVLGEFALNNKKSHSVKLMPEIERLLSECGKSAVEIDAFACVNGPGSYTGLRIGASTCKLLAYSLGKPLITVRTPDFLAESVGIIPPNSILCACIDARNTQMFYGVYKSCFDGKDFYYELVGDYDAEAADVVCKKLVEIADEYKVERIFFTGDGAVKNEELLRSLVGNNRFGKVSACLVLGKASAIGVLAQRIYESCEDKTVFKPENAEVFYLRTPHLTIKKAGQS